MYDVLLNWQHNSRNLSETDQAWRESGSESQSTWFKRKSTKPHSSWLTSITTNRTWQELTLTAFLILLASVECHFPLFFHITHWRFNHLHFCGRPDLMQYGLIIDVHYWCYKCIFSLLLNLHSVTWSWTHVPFIFPTGTRT